MKKRETKREKRIRLIEGIGKGYSPLSKEARASLERDYIERFIGIKSNDPSDWWKDP